ncbi:MAG: hypothetical protein DRH33_07930 [Candidatus Nealsonbacteria bacterium]|nr:MAG: hypothetical protein DRH33_07930 [Candidatus Nealsonbacteria bacterium]
MLKTREILRLRHELGLSLREIGQVCRKTTRGRLFVCQSPITVDKEYIYQDDVYAGKAIGISKEKYITL